jgi:hypothetical protein
VNSRDAPRLFTAITFVGPGGQRPFLALLLCRLLTLDHPPDPRFVSHATRLVGERSSPAASRSEHSDSGDPESRIRIQETRSLVV